MPFLLFFRKTGNVFPRPVWYNPFAAAEERKRKAIPYVILANQFICIAWFAEQDKYAEIFETNKKMTAWLIRNLDKLKAI